MKIHIVQKGDTLWKIAKKYGVDFEELKMLNSQLSNTDMIMPGMKIKVPTTGGSIKKEAPKMGTVKEMPKTTQQPIVKEQPIAMPKKEMPIKEMPKKEAPKEKPYTPKMPKPIIPEIDVHNYYTMNMTNIDVDVEMEETKVTPPAPVVTPPVQEPIVQPIQQEPCPPIIPYQPYCYEVSPMMPGSGFPPGVYPQVSPVEQIPTTHGALPGVEHTNHMHWEESSSSFHGQHGYNQHQMHQQVPADYYQQPLVQHGQMPIPNYQAESSSQVMGVNYMPNMAPQQPYQMPFKEDCGCSGPSFQQPIHAHPSTFQVEGNIYPEMGGYPMPGEFNQGIPTGMNPEMGGYPMGGGYNPGMPMGMQPGMNPEMGGYPMGGGYNPGMPMGMQPGMNPEMGGYPMGGGYNPGMNPEMGGYPMGGGYNPGMPMGMQPGMNPEMGGYPMGGGYNPGMPMGIQPGMNPEMSNFPMQEPFAMNPTSMNSPYPQGVGGNIPFEGSMQQPISGDMTPPMMGPGGNAPVYAPPFNTNVGQPPFMNPYGFNQGTPFGMPRYQEDESSDL